MMAPVRVIEPTVSRSIRSSSSPMARGTPATTSPTPGQALAFYSWDPDEQAYMPFALNVLTLRGEKRQVLRLA